MGRRDEQRTGWSRYIALEITICIACLTLVAGGLSIARAAGTAQALETVAGNGTAGYAGDGGPAVSALMFIPTRTCTDGSGNLFFIDSYNHRVRKVDMTVSPPVITTVAGGGPITYAEPTQPLPAPLLMLFGPDSIAADSAGNVYIADFSRTCIVWKVDTNSGVALRYAGDYGRMGSIDNMPAWNSTLGSPASIAVDSRNNLYITDAANNVVRKVDGQSGIITSVAGNRTAGQYSDNSAATATSIMPGCVATDTSDNLYITDTIQQKVLKVAPNTGVVTAVGVCPSPRASGICADDKGNVYITADDRIYKLSSGALTVTAGTGSYGYSPDGTPAAAASLNLSANAAACVDLSGNLYIPDSYNNIIRKVSLAEVVPACPAMIAAVAEVARQSDSVAVTWSPPADESSVAGYKVYRDGITGPIAIIPASGLPVYSFMDGNVDECSRYCYRVVSYNAEGSESPDCAFACADTPDVTPPSQPSDLHVAGMTESSVSLSWDASADRCTAPSGLTYNVYKDGVYAGNTALTGYTDSISGCARLYSYAVSATDGSRNESARCVPVNVTIPDTTPPDAPNDLAAAAVSGTEVMLIWDISTDGCNGGPAAGYNVWTKEGRLAGTTTANSFKVSGLRGCTEYCFCVTAFDKSGNSSEMSNTACAATPAVLTTGGANIPKHGGAYKLGSAIPVRFTITQGSLPVGPAMIGNPVPRLYFKSSAGWTEVAAEAVGSPDGLFKCDDPARGIWQINLKAGKAGKGGSSLEPGDYMLTVEPNAAGNRLCQRVEFSPVPTFYFSLTDKK